MWPDFVFTLAAKLVLVFTLVSLLSLVFVARLPVLLQSVVVDVQRVATRAIASAGVLTPVRLHVLHFSVEVPASVP